MSDRFSAALALFDAANGEDPRRVRVEGVERPKELVYGERMTARLEAFEPEASEALRLAARCQHIRRWEIPRSEFPMDKAGYKRWRRRLAEFHAEAAGQVLRQAGYGEDDVTRVGALLRKKKLKIDPETQTLEDVVCLVFLEHEFEEFAAKHDDAKVIEILRKTWKKMSPRGHEAALALDLEGRELALVERALTL